jgi:hypothetical protein
MNESRDIELDIERSTASTARIREALPRLHRIAEAAPKALGEDGAWTAAFIAALASGASVRQGIDAAARSERDRLLRELRAAHYATFKRRPAAERISTDLLRYEATASWRQDRHSTECPYRDTDPRATFWRLLKTGIPIPQWRRLINIL